jgi:hypothetical protein
MEGDGIPRLREREFHPGISAMIALEASAVEKLEALLRPGPHEKHDFFIGIGVVAVGPRVGRGP